MTKLNVSVKGTLDIVDFDGMVGITDISEVDDYINWFSVYGCEATSIEGIIPPEEYGRAFQLTFPFLDEPVVLSIVDTSDEEKVFMQFELVYAGRELNVSHLAVMLHSLMTLIVYQDVAGYPDLKDSILSGARLPEDGLYWEEI